MPLQIRRNLPEQHTTEDNPFIVEDEDGVKTVLSAKKVAAAYLAKTERDPIFVENNLAVAYGHLIEAHGTLSHIRGAIENPALARAIEEASREVMHTLKSLQPLQGKAWALAASRQAAEMWELYYSGGGHGGPYHSEDDADKGAYRYIEGLPRPETVEVRPYSSPAKGGFKRHNPGSRYITTR